MIRDMIARSLFRQLSIVVSFTLMDICKALICTKLLAFYSCSRQQWIGQTRAIIYLIIHILSQKKKKVKGDRFPESIMTYVRIRRELYIT